MAGSGSAAERYRRVRVNRLVSSRYGGVTDKSVSDERPQSWDDRRSGIDTVEIEGGEVVRLASTPMQSAPRPNWVLMLTGGDAQQGFTWTLYGMPRSH